MTWTRMTVVLAVLACALSTPAQSLAAYESGSSSKRPWSGYWWPTLSSSLNLYDTGEALPKLDSWVYMTTGTSGGATAWEKRNHATTDSTNTWWGHCHAWAAAAILADEPPSSLTRNGVTFDNDNLKGLVTELYYEPRRHWLRGVRSTSDDPTTPAYKDIEPVWMDYLLRLYIGHYRTSMIMDLNADSQVWNYPVFAYDRTTTARSDGSTAVTARIWYASPKNGVRGTYYKSKTYTYVLRSGTYGVWTGNSVYDHPDFAWLPQGYTTSARTNPHITTSRVRAILGSTYRL